ncbi:MAG: hypothetical protein V4604_08155 [Bacteroidota bacterium]
MSLIKDFNELDFSYKGAALVIGSNIPIFFVSIYLFEHDLIADIEGNPWGSLKFYFVLCVCLTLSILWSLTSLMFSIHKLQLIERRERVNSMKDMHPLVKLLTKSTPQRKTKEATEKSLRVTFITTYAYATTLLAACIFINQQFLHLSFPYFLLGSWVFIVIRIFYVAVKSEMLREKLEAKPVRRKVSLEAEGEESKQEVL